MTKKLIAGMLAASMMASTIALPASAVVSDSAAPSEGISQSMGKVASNKKFTYRVEPSGNITLLDFSKKAISKNGVVTIPSKIGNKTVTTIDSSAAWFFQKNWKKIKKVVIPKTVTGIGFDGYGGYEGYGGYGIGWKDTLKPNDEDDYYYARNNNVTIECYEGSVAEYHAIANSIKYTLIDKKKSTLQGVIIKDGISVAGKSVRFSWNAVSGATGYKVYRSTYNRVTGEYGKDKVIKIVSGKNNTSFRDTKLNSYCEYTYRVAAYKKSKGKTVAGHLSRNIYINTKPGKCKLTKTTTKQKGFIAVKVPTKLYKSKTMDLQVYDPYNKKWCDASYMYNNNASSNKNTTLEINGYYVGLKYNDKSVYDKLKSGKSYKVRVRFAGSANSEPGYYKYFYSDYSNTVTAKTK